jgi:hypothetical protein
MRTTQKHAPKTASTKEAAVVAGENKERERERE